MSLLLEMALGLSPSMLIPVESGRRFRESDDPRETKKVFASSFSLLLPSLFSSHHLALGMSLFISALGTIIGVPLQADTAREESTPALTIAVVGASGNQGSGVVDALLNSTDFNVRGITTHISDNSKVKELLSDQSSYVKEGRFEFVEADLNDRDSLEKALKGCYGVFAAFGKGIKAEGENGEDNEVTQGKNLVDAAKASRTNFAISLPEQ